MRKLISIVTASALLLTCPGNTVQGATLNSDHISGSSPVSIEETDIKTDRGKVLKFFGENPSHISLSDDYLNKKVTLIVEMTKTSLLDVFNRQTAAMKLEDTLEERNSFAAFKNTSNAERIEDTALDQQERTIQKISVSLYQGDSVEVVEQFTDIINAFVMKGSIADIDDIEKLPEVKSVSISKSYERIKPVNDSKSIQDTGTGNQLIHADNLPYQGEGMVVAVLDTGLDINHEAFSAVPKNQKYHKEDIDKIISANDLLSEKSEYPIQSSNDVYVNDKIPYVYDYYYGDNDVTSSEQGYIDGNDHGTHVAGIVTANSKAMSGIAPEAQLMMMKIFPDSDGGSPDYVYYKALEDCVTLGVDVINLSIGSACGYTNENSDAENEILNRIAKAGINLNISASNHGSSAENNSFGYHRALTSNPDTSTVGHPSTNTSALSVASVDNTVIYQSSVLLSDGTKIGVNDPAVRSSDSFVKLISGNKKWEYIYVNIGAEEDYKDIDVTGKIAVVKRGNLTFQKKLEYAYKHGAIGLIVINNTLDTISMSIDNFYIPAVSITSVDGEKLLSQAEYFLTVSDYEFLPKKTAGSISDFSSWGVTPDLLLKPEITAVGGSVYSTLPFNKYGNMGGTSMAAPQVTAISTILKESIKGNPKYSDTTKEDLEHLVTCLLMSTATPIRTSVRTVTGSAISASTASGCSITAAYSPRRQGAGLVNASAAINTNALIYTTEKTGRPVLNLGDDPAKSGTFTKAFHIRNYSDVPLRYQMDSTVLTESCEAHENNTFISETPTLLNNKVSFRLTDAVRTVTGSSILSKSASSTSQITVNPVSGCALELAPYEDVEITASISLTREDKKYIERYFENGEFIEGFIQLISLDKDPVDIGLPFVGFYGDWTKAPILDYATFYDNPNQKGYRIASNVPTSDVTKPEYFANLSQLIGLSNKSETPLILGQNPFRSDPTYDKNKIAISPNDDGILDGCFLWAYPALRGPKKTDYTLTDRKGNQIYSDTINGHRKSTYDSEAKNFSVNLQLIDWIGTGKDNKTLPNNSVVDFTFKAHLDYSAHASNNLCDTVTLPVTIDTKAPDLLASLYIKPLKVLPAMVKDNQYIAAALLYDYTDNTIKEIIDGYTLDEPKKNSISLLNFKLGNDLNKQYMISLIDYAGNESNYIIKLK